MELVEVSCFYVSHCNWNSVVICLGIWISANIVGLISCPWPQTTNLFWLIYEYFLTKFCVLIFLMMLRNARVLFFQLMSSASHMSIWQEKNWNVQVTVTPWTHGNCCWKVSWNPVIKNIKSIQYSNFVITKFVNEMPRTQKKLDIFSICSRNVCILFFAIMLIWFNDHE